MKNGYQFAIMELADGGDLVNEIKSVIFLGNLTNHLARSRAKEWTYRREHMPGVDVAIDRFY